MSNKLKAFPLYTSNSGCDYHRVRLPFMYGADHFDYEAYQGFTIEKLTDYLAISDVVVWNRAFPIGLQKAVEFKAIYGYKIVVDLDDWWQLPWQHPLYNHYKSVAAKEIMANVKLADLVTVTTERLSEKVRPLNSNVHVIPNALPFGEGQFTARTPRQDDVFNIVYAGQSSHLQDVRILENPFKRIKQLPGIGLQLAGYVDHPIWYDMEKVFSSMLNYKRIKQEPIHSYMSVYNNADCAIVPLVDNDFNRHKSNLKLLEAAAKKIPVICSYVPPYSDCEDAPVLWVKKQSDWYEHIRYISRDRQAARQMGEALHEWAKRKYELFDWNNFRFDIYKQVVSN